MKSKSYLFLTPMFQENKENWLPKLTTYLPLECHKWNSYNCDLLNNSSYVL